MHTRVAPSPRRAFGVDALTGEPKRALAHAQLDVAVAPRRAIRMAGLGNRLERKSVLGAAEHHREEGDAQPAERVH